MLKYKYTFIWLIFFSIAIGIGAVFLAGEEEPNMYNPGVIAGAILVFFCCPAYIYDYKHTEKYKLKQKEQQLRLQLQHKRIEATIKQQDIDIERQEVLLENERLKSDDSHKFCIYCGKEIEYRAIVCPFCGSELNKELEPSRLTQRSQQYQNQHSRPIIIQTTPKPNLLRQLIKWIISQIYYFICISVLMTFMIIMMYLML